MDDFVGQGSAARHHADRARLADVAWKDSDLRESRTQESRTIGADQTRQARGRPVTGARARAQSGDVMIGLEGVADRNAFGDAHDQAHAGVRGFDDRVGGERRRNVDHRGVGARLHHRLGDAVEDRHAVHLLPALAGRDAGHDLRAVAHHLLGVERTVATGDALHQQARAPVDQDAHARTSCAFAITARTPSSMLVVAERP